MLISLCPSQAKKMKMFLDLLSDTLYPSRSCRTRSGVHFFRQVYTVRAVVAVCSVRVVGFPLYYIRMRRGETHHHTNSELKRRRFYKPHQWDRKEQESAMATSSRSGGVIVELVYSGVQVYITDAT